ncbi:cysteine proteinase [Wolfiporia cocos MD-104 SS10]|uniref:Cysteine proteinase n=1 Tax=Wolfiporia cocos (strain MD-104) TaxID=742152 RepID=A0A2H3J4L1_WOLCO|nr:cysteine proteinase [Wolfiporia cocos MD-104 SS10]
MHEAETTYSKAAKAELHNDLDRAFRLYVKAAEDFLHKSQSCDDARLRTVCKEQAGKALERAEKIKAVKPDVTPVAKNYFSDREQQYVLRRSSFVNNIRIPLWDEELSSFDNTQPKLSLDQLRHGAEWKKLTDVPVYSSADPLRPRDIIQQIITDCSVCGSVAVCVNHHCRFGSEIVRSNLRPQSPDDSLYQSRTGIYHFRLLFNGAFRRVTVDDSLPAYPDGSLMCMSTGSKQQLWPPLVEKAYMKLMGGYDFPGSNSCIDLHALAGWIPEHICFSSARNQLERLWARIVNGTARGYCLLTLGTGDRVETDALSPIPLLPDHCYAVIDVKDDLGDRRLTVLDPWVIHSSDDDSSSGDTQVGKSPSIPFDISWDVVCNVFDGIYLSWDPGIFEKQICFHGAWKVQKGQECASHFQLRLRADLDSTAQGKQSVWILLTRHVSDTRRTSEYISLIVNSQNEPGSLKDVNAMALKGEYTNSIHTLVRTQVSQTESVLQIIAAYDGQLDDVGFTITAYSITDISWIEDIPRALYVKEVDGAFTAKTSGGNFSCSSFMDNPQYHLRVHAAGGPARSRSSMNVKTQTLITMQGPRSIPLNAAVVWSRGERITDVGLNELAVSSGPYSYGFAHAAGDLPPGDYTLIVSSFEPQQLGQFKLRVESSLAFDLTPIPQEGAGMFSKVFRDAWSAETAGGGPSFNQYKTNPAYEVQVDTPTQLKARLTLSEPAPPVSINVTIYQRKTPHAPATVVATSGPYADALAGVATPQAALQPGAYVVVPSTYHPGVQRAFRLTIYSTSPVRAAPTRQV